MSDASTSSRLLTLLSLLQGRRDWPGGELAGRLEVSGRTVRRDVERLRGLGYPVESLTGPAGGYRLAAGTAMPPLLLDDDEAIAIAVGLRTAARASVTGIEETSVRALVKLEQVLPAHLRRRVQALQSATMTMPTGGGPTVDPQTLTVIAAACRDAERAALRLPRPRRRASRREVEPHSLVNVGRRWYLVAWDCGRRDWRTFRARPPHAAGAGRPLHAARAARQGRRRLREPEPVGGAEPLRGAAHAARLGRGDAQARRRDTGAPFEPIDDASCEYRTGDDNLDWLAARITMLGVDFDVHEPPELRRRTSWRWGGGWGRLG